MPEIPDLEYIAHALKQRALGRPIEAVRVKEPIVLRQAIEGDLAELLVGAKLTAVERRAHFLRFTLDRPLELIVNAMLAGRFKLAPREAKTEAALCLALDFGGEELRYLDDKKMGKVYLVRAGDHRQVPGFEARGLDTLGRAFTLERFTAVLEKRRDQVRPFIMDKRAIDALGNAYADEVLWEARLHPKTRCSQLTPEEIARLHAAIPKVLREAMAEVKRRQAPIEEKVRDFLKVRGRAGEPCPRCGTKIRTARVLDADACFCPECQPAARKLFIDWSKVPKKD